jgi:prophage regulatory protein
MVQRIIRRLEVEKICGLSRSSIYSQMAEGIFPKPIKIGRKAVGWLESEIEQLQADRIARRDTPCK